MMTAPRPQPIIGFLTQTGRYVCRDSYCVKLITIKGDAIRSIIKATSWDHSHCDFCQEILRR